MSWKRTLLSAKPWSVATLAERSRIAIDSTLLIYLIEGAEPDASRATVLAHAIERRPLTR